MSAESIQGHIARKRFGQNFLKDQSVIDKMVADINPLETDELIEIGPGLGALTLSLLPRTQHLSVIEIDRDLAHYWRNYQQTAKQRPNQVFTVFESDALKFDFQQFALNLAQPVKKIRVVGNLPYNISSPLLFSLQAAIKFIQDQHFMLQKEVVDRMVATPGSSQFSRLSVMLQATYQMRCLQIVPPQAFEPAPKVWSAIVHMVPHQSPVVPPQHWQVFAQVVALAFSQRRKMLRGVLKPYIAQLERVGIPLTARAEDVTVQQFAQLAQLLFEAQPNAIDGV